MFAITEVLALHVIDQMTVNVCLKHLVKLCLSSASAFYTTESSYGKWSFVLWVGGFFKRGKEQCPTFAGLLSRQIVIP